MREIKYYKVGGHIFTISNNCSEPKALNLAAFKPFEIEQTEGALFEVEVIDEINEPIIEDLIIDAPQDSSGMPSVNIYRTESGLLYTITMPRSNEVNASLLINTEQRRVLVTVNGEDIYEQNALNNAIILSYISFTMEHNTLLLHASTVIHEGAAYLFLGKSGTGKSTHSRMWLESFKGSELLNDDHPIIRLFDDGSITVYGSPWSGKTPCYRNLSAPMGAIVRIERAATNSIERLRPLKAYASLTTSCSGVQWSKKLYNDKVKAVEGIISNSRSYTMHCLPDNDAARICYNYIKEDK